MPDEENNDTTVNPPDDGAEEQSAVDSQEDDYQQPTEDHDDDEKTLNKLRSWIGRRDKELEDRITSKVSEILMRVPHNVPNIQQQSSGFTTPEDQDPEPDVFTQPKEWFRWEQRQQTRNQTVAKQQAEQVYFQTLSNPGVRHSDERIHEAVMKELNSTGHNNNIDPMTGHPMSPSADAMLNYNRALRSVLEKQLGTPPANPLEGNQPPKPGFGVSQPGATEKRGAAMPRNLSPYAQKLIRHAGWGADKVRKVLE